MASIQEWAAEQEQEEYEEAAWPEDGIQEELKHSLGEELFAAVIKKGFLKTRKGSKAKGNGKARECYKCKGDHLIADCPTASPAEKDAVMTALKEKGKAKAAGKTKLVIDLSSNGGGNILTGYDAFRQYVLGSPFSSVFRCFGIFTRCEGNHT